MLVRHCSFSATSIIQRNPMEDYVSNCKISQVKRALSGMSVKQNKLNTTNRTENEALSTLNNAIIEVKQ